jgi:hypothetical protein
VAEAWGRLNVPDPVPVVDGLMAATALVHDWTLVTRNVDDAASIGVRVLDPFARESQTGDKPAVSHTRNQPAG